MEHFIERRAQVGFRLHANPVVGDFPVAVNQDRDRNAIHVIALKGSTLWVDDERKIPGRFPAGGDPTPRFVETPMLQPYLTQGPSTPQDRSLSRTILLRSG